MEKVDFYKIDYDLPTYDDTKYNGIFVLTTTNDNLYVGTSSGWKELTGKDSPKTVNGVLPDENGDIDLHRTLCTQQSGSNISLTLDANKYYSFGEVAKLDISLNPLHNSSHVGEYIISFYSGLTPTQLSLPANMMILGNSTIRSNSMYMLRIINNICELLTTDTTVAPPIIDPDTPADSYFKLGDFNDITDDSIVVILGRKKETTQWYAMSNNNGTSAAPSAVAYDFDENSNIDVVDNTIIWKASVYDDGTVTFKLVDDDTKWLYSTATNNGMRVGKGEGNKFGMKSDYIFVFGNINRYVGVYDSQDWRGYTNIPSNISNQEFKFLIKK